MGNLLEAEDGILSAADARPLARTLVENLPPEYAAAPDLLAALEEIHNETTTDIDGLDRDELNSLRAYVEDIARAAISRARGEAQ